MTIKKECIFCHESFITTEARVKMGRGKNCSLVCRGLSQAMKPGNAAGKKWSKESRNKFSISKLLSVPRGVKSRSWKGGKPKCEDCKISLSNYKNKRCKPCTGRNKKGENHPRWIVDRSKLQKYGDDNKDRRSASYREWRKDVWGRDNFKCKINNLECRGRIEAHHIMSWVEYKDLRYKSSNGITLCHFHHPKSKREEVRLSDIFTNLIKIT